jgi:tRNA nucleotidyltransferase (CCA-adding enzyme)
VSADAYLREILKKYEVNAAGAESAGQRIYPLLVDWSNGYLPSASFSGSLAKGTGVSLGTDADIFLSLSSAVPETLAQIYEALFKTMEGAGYTPRRQNVSIGVKVNGYAIDLVPARRQSHYGNDHSLYKSKTNSWTQTNVDTRKGAGTHECSIHAGGEATGQA